MSSFGGTRGPRTLRAAAVAACAALVAACAGQSPIENAPGRPTAGSRPESAAGPAYRAQSGTRIAELALSFVGSPYLYGGESPDGFDCSGLVWFSYRSNGLDVPRTSLALYGKARKIPLADARPGDLVFFQDQIRLSHVGIYLGGDRFVHAPASGRSVAVARLSDPYYQMHLVGVGRLTGT